jgi:hypothetical protein
VCPCSNLGKMQTVSLHHHFFIEVQRAAVICVGMVSDDWSVVGLDFFLLFVEKMGRTSNLFSFLLCFSSVGLSSAIVWPLPSSFTNGSQTALVVPNPGVFFVMASGQESNTLSQAFSRYDYLTFPHPAQQSTPDSSSILSLIVNVANIDESVPQLETDESYDLVIPADGGEASLSANTIYGALRGLETFSQMVVFDFDERAYYIDNLPWNINDTPRFPHRGLMVRRCLGVMVFCWAVSNSLVVGWLWLWLLYSLNMRYVSTLTFSAPYLIIFHNIYTFI